MSKLLDDVQFSRFLDSLNQRFADESPQVLNSHMEWVITGGNIDPFFDTHYTLRLRGDTRSLYKVYFGTRESRGGEVGGMYNAVMNVTTYIGAAIVDVTTPDYFAFIGRAAWNGQFTEFQINNIVQVVQLKYPCLGGGDGVPGTPGTPDSFVAVTDIFEMNPRNPEVGRNYELQGYVVPENATNQTIVWAVVDAGDTQATILEGYLITQAAGTVTVQATIHNGAAVGKDFTETFTYTVVQSSNRIPVENLLLTTPEIIENRHPYTCNVTGETKLMYMLEAGITYDPLVFWFSPSNATTFMPILLSLVDQDGVPISKCGVIHDGNKFTGIINPDGGTCIVFLRATIPSGIDISVDYVQD